MPKTKFGRWDFLGVGDCDGLVTFFVQFNKIFYTFKLYCFFLGGVLQQHYIPVAIEVISLKEFMSIWVIVVLKLHLCSLFIGQNPYFQKLQSHIFQ